MQKKQLGYDQVSRVLEPTHEQISLAKFFEDPLHVYLLSDGTGVSVIGKSGRKIKAFARSFKDGLILSCRLPCSSFQYGQKLLIVIEVGHKSYAIQTLIKSAHMGDLYVEDTSTRFYPRFKTMIRASACPLPAHYVANVMKGQWYIERQTEESSDGKYKFTDNMVDWRTSQKIENIKPEHQNNVLVTSLSQGGFAISRNLTPNSRPLKHIVLSCGYYHKGTFIQLELYAVARESEILGGVETTNFALLSPLPQLTEDIFPHEKKINLTFNEKVEIYVNGEIKGYSDNLNVHLPPGKHNLVVVKRNGRTFEDTLVIDSFTDGSQQNATYKLFPSSRISCTATESEHEFVTASGI